MFKAHQTNTSSVMSAIMRLGTGVLAMVFAVVLVFSPTSVYAGIASGSVIFDLADMPFDIKSSVEESLQTTNSFIEQFNDGPGKALANVAAQRTLEAINSSIINWANQGFEGNPLFIDNPTQFFENIAFQEATLIADQVKSDFLGSNEGYGREILGFLGEASFVTSSDRLDFTLDDIAKGVTGDAESWRDFVGTEGRFILPSEISGAVDEAGNQVSADPWELYTGLTSDNATPLAASWAAEQVIRDRVAASQQEIKDELSGGGSFLGARECDPEFKVELSDGVEVCTRWNITTPGALVEDQISQSLNSGIGRLVNSDDLGEVLSNGLSQLITGLTNAGLKKLASEVGNLGSNNAVNFQQSFQDATGFGDPFGSDDELAGTGTNDAFDWLNQPLDIDVIGVLLGASFEGQPGDDYVDPGTPEVCDPDRLEDAGVGALGLTRCLIQIRNAYDALLAQMPEHLMELDHCLPGPDRGYQSRLRAQIARESSRVQRKAASNRDGKADKADADLMRIELLETFLIDHIENSLVTNPETGGTDAELLRLQSLVEETDRFINEVIENDRRTGQYRSLERHLTKLSSDYIEERRPANQIAADVYAMQYNQDPTALPTYEDLRSARRGVDRISGEITRYREALTDCNTLMREPQFALASQADKNLLLYCPFEAVLNDPEDVGVINFALQGASSSGSNMSSLVKAFARTEFIMFGIPTRHPSRDPNPWIDFAGGSKYKRNTRTGSFTFMGADQPETQSYQIGEISIGVAAYEEKSGERVKTWEQLDELKGLRCNDFYRSTRFDYIPDNLSSF